VAQTSTVEKWVLGHVEHLKLVATEVLDRVEGVWVVNW